MKGFLFAYLAIGLFLAGGTMGEGLKACPDTVHEPIDGVKILTVAAVWPAIMVALTIAGDAVKDASIRCPAVARP